MRPAAEISAVKMGSSDDCCDINLAGRHALIADDANSALMILAGMLKKQGMRVTPVDSGEAAIRAVRTHAPGEFDIVVMDVVMDKMDGVQAASSILSLPERGRLPIVLMSATVDENLRRRCSAAGIPQRFISKPYRAEHVISALKQCLSNQTPPPAAASLGDLPELQRMELDVQGALERCGNNTLLLISLLRAHQAEVPQRFGDIARLVREGDAEGAVQLLHRERGDLLNLGLDGQAHGIDSIEKGLLRQIPDGSPAESSSGSKGLTSDLRTVVLASLAGLPESIFATIEEMLSLVERQGATSESGQNAALPVLDDASFGEFVKSLANRETQALLRLPIAAERILPQRYPSGVDQEFRRHMAELDFGAALSLLDNADLEVAGRSTAGEAEELRIMIVDDAAATIRMLGGILNGIGMTAVRFARSANEAMDLMATWMPDVILCDVYMPDTTGIEFCRMVKMRQDCAHVALILISADSGVTNEVAAFTAGAADFIEKPVNPARIVSRVRAQLTNTSRATRTALQASAPDESLGFITCRNNGVIVDAGPKILDLIGRSAPDTAGMTLTELFGQKWKSQIESALQSCQVTGRFPVLDLLLFSATRQSAIPVRVYGWSAPGVSSRLAWLTIQNRERILVNARRNQEKKVTRAIDTIAGGIAHEFNNLLNIAIGNLDSLKEEFLSVTQSRRAEQAAKALLRAAEISRRLGDLSMQGQRKSSHPQSLNTLLDQFWSILAGALPKNVTLRREGSTSDAPVVLDGQELCPTLLALAENAATAMPKGGVLTIRTHVEPGSNFILLEVADTGQGMSREVMDRAFEPFFSTRSPEKVGLGLTQVRYFVEACGGHVEIQSNPGIGTRVSLSFRIAA